MKSGKSKSDMNILLSVIIEKGKPYTVLIIQNVIQVNSSLLKVTTHRNGRSSYQSIKWSPTDELLTFVVLPKITSERIQLQLFYEDYNVLIYYQPALKQLIIDHFHLKVKVVQYREVGRLKLHFYLDLILLSTIK